MPGNSYMEDEKKKKYKEFQKKNLEYFNKYRKSITGAAAGDKEMKFLSEMAPSVDDEIFKKIKALIK
jgi:hypothetical protein